MAEPTASTANRCPRCGSAEWIPIVYGMPTGETFDAYARGEVALGGCVIFEEQPEFQCRKCSTDR